MASVSINETGSVFYFSRAEVYDYTDNGNGTATIEIDVYAERVDSHYPFEARTLTLGTYSGVSSVELTAYDVYGSTMGNYVEDLVGTLEVVGTPDSNGVITCTINLTGGGQSTGYGWKYTDTKITKISGIYVTNKYTITYNANGGSGTAPSSHSVTPGNSITLRDNTFTRSGYVFIGWGTSTTSTSVRQPGTSYTPDKTRTFYAIWKQGGIKIYTSDGWKDAIPYVYTSSGWKKAIPYVYKSSTDGWKASVL